MSDARDPVMQAKFERALTDPGYKAYLERTGVLPAIRDCLHYLYNADVEERPMFATEYIRKQMEKRCGAKPDPLVALKEARARIEQLQEENKRLRESTRKAIQEKRWVPAPKRRRLQ